MGNWTHKIKTEEELKELVRGVYDCKIFTSLQCSDRDAISIFMPLMFIGSGPSAPSMTNNIKLDRKNKLNHIDACVAHENETSERNEYIRNIGMIYEDYSKAGPRSMNGYPMFMSCQLVSIDDTKRFREMYGKYEKMREDFEKEWGK